VPLHRGVKIEFDLSTDTLVLDDKLIRALGGRFLVRWIVNDTGRIYLGMVYANTLRQLFDTLDEFSDPYRAEIMGLQEGLIVFPMAKVEGYSDTKEWAFVDKFLEEDGGLFADETIYLGETIIELLANPEWTKIDWKFLE